ncbi:MAG: NRDE family protein [Sphingomonas sp.]
MCVLAMAWRPNAGWRLVAAGNRDELHARPALPLARWGNGVIAGRDAVGGGTWLGVSEAGRFAVVTNVRSPDGPDPAKASRGRLVVDMLAGGAGGVARADLERFNPFNLIVADGEGAQLLSNRPQPVRTALARGMHGLSNGLHDAPWPKTLALQNAVKRWLAQGNTTDTLFEVLRDEHRYDHADAEEIEPVGSPIFIRDPRYGTRCSTVVTVDVAGNGVIAERRFDAAGNLTGETRLSFAWPD